MSSYQPAMAPVVERLAREVSEGFICTGAQLYVSLEGECVVDFAAGVDGLRKPVQPDSLFAIYCTAKPLIALAVAHLVTIDELSWHDKIGNVLEGYSSSSIGQITFEQLLSHSSGLPQAPPHVMAIMPRPQKQAYLSTLALEPHPAPRYNEYNSWHILGEAVEELSGTDYRTYIMQEVLRPLGLANDIYAGVPPDRVVAVRQRLCTNVGFDGNLPYPLLLESDSSFLQSWNPAYGGYATASGLGRLYEFFLQPSSWASSVLTEMTSLRSPRSYDATLQRVCGYGLGFMVNLKDHLFGDMCSASAFGHSGVEGISFAFADPAHGLAMAAVFNGMIDGDTSITFRRPALIDQVYRALQLSTVPG